MLGLTGSVLVNNHHHFSSIGVHWHNSSFGQVQIWVEGLSDGWWQLCKLTTRLLVDVNCWFTTTRRIVSTMWIGTIRDFLYKVIKRSIFINLHQCKPDWNIWIPDVTMVEVCRLQKMIHFVEKYLSYIRICWLFLPNTNNCKQCWNGKDVIQDTW